jgi:hypothetical protein
MDLLWENENIAKGTFQGITKVLLQTQIGYIKLSFGVFAKLIDINICTKFHYSTSFRKWLVYRVRLISLHRGHS